MEVFCRVRTEKALKYHKSHHGTLKRLMEAMQAHVFLKDSLLKLFFRSAFQNKNDIQKEPNKIHPPYEKCMTLSDLKLPISSRCLSKLECCSKLAVNTVLLGCRFSVQGPFGSSDEYSYSHFIHSSASVSSFTLSRG